MLSLAVHNHLYSLKVKIIGNTLGFFQQSYSEWARMKVLLTYLKVLRISINLLEQLHRGKLLKMDLDKQSKTSI